MNLLDFSVTPLWLVWDSVRDAGRRGRRRTSPSPSSSGSRRWPPSWPSPTTPAPRPTDPVETRLAAAAAYLRLRDFAPSQALELRLDAAQRPRPIMSGGPFRVIEGGRTGRGDARASSSSARPRS